MANEKWLIDANDLWQKTFICDEVAEVRKFIEKAPTVDAVEVVHGRWDIFDDGYGCELMCCSVCRSEFYDGDNDTVDHPHNYCPNCGAKMDGDGNG